MKCFRVEKGKTMARKKKLDKLSLDMIQCEKDGYGVSYGRWKATQEPVKIEKIEIPVVSNMRSFSRICPYCGTEFETFNSRKKHCSKECCDRANYQKRREIIIEKPKKRYAAKKRQGASM